MIAAATEALANLRVDSALYTGKARPGQGFENPTLEVRFERRPGLGPPLAFQIGAAGEHRGIAVFFARAKAGNVTFIIARSKLRPLLDLF